jgi:hypothetical protein
VTRFDVFGRLVLVSKNDGRWTAWYAGDEGKRRLASDIVIPSDIEEGDLERYLADLCHEWATSRHQSVRRL